MVIENALVALEGGGGEDAVGHNFDWGSQRGQNLQYQLADTVVVGCSGTESSRESSGLLGCKW